MTSRALSAKGTAWNLFLLTLKKNFGITVLIAVFMLLVCPGYILVEIERYFEYGSSVYDFNDLMPGLIGAISVLTCITAVICCFINFAFMYSKKSGDLYYALPMTRSGLLLSRFFASMAPSLLPIILCYGSMGIILLSNRVWGDFSTVAIGALFNILLVFMSCCITMLFIVCAGSITDLLISYCGLNIGAVVISLMFFWLCDEYLLGFYSYSEENFIIFSSPFLYGFAYLVRFAKEGFVFNTELLVYILKLCVISLACIISSIFLFRRRKSEKCTGAYAYKGMYCICSLTVGFACAFLVGMLFSGNVGGIFFWLFGAVGAVLGAITFGLITDRGFKTVKRSVVLGACSFGVMLILVIILKTGGFGYSKCVPIAEKVEGATVSIANMNIEFQDPEPVIALHKKALQNIDSDEIELAQVTEVVYGLSDTLTVTENGEDHVSHVTIRYTLKNGFEMNREFWINTSGCAEELTAIFKSDENIKAIRQKTDSFISDVSIYGNITEIGNEKYISTNITKAEAKIITEAYAADLQEADEEIVYTDYSDSVYIDGTVVGQEWDSVTLNIFKNFERTNKALEDLKLVERSLADMEEY